jgi:putative NIF3 family GTP cyclohydrolase 1 type 2
VAFDVVPLAADPTARAGLGIIGNLKKAATIQSLATRLKRALKISSVGVVGDLKKEIESVAICTGAGGSVVRSWRRGTADLLLTGEMTHHECAEAHEMGLPVLLVGHWASEAIVSPRVADLLRMTLSERGFGEVDITVSKAEKNPLQRI